MKKFIISIDQGTTSSRVVLFDTKGFIQFISQYEFKQYFPRNGWVEHNPIEIWETQQHTLTQLLENNNIKAEQIDSIGITNQRETTVLWNKKTGKPVYRAIVWQDRRTAQMCENLSKQATTFIEKTGLVLDAYFSGTKVKCEFAPFHISVLSTIISPTYLLTILRWRIVSLLH